MSSSPRLEQTGGLLTEFLSPEIETIDSSIHSGSREFRSSESINRDGRKQKLEHLVRGDALVFVLDGSTTLTKNDSFDPSTLKISKTDCSSAVRSGSFRKFPSKREESRPFDRADGTTTTRPMGSSAGVCGRGNTSVQSRRTSVDPKAQRDRAIRRGAIQ